MAKRPFEDTIDVFDGDIFSENPYSDTMKDWLTNKEDETNDNES